MGHVYSRQRLHTLKRAMRVCSGDYTCRGAQSLQPSPLPSCLQYSFLGYALCMSKQQVQSLQVVFALLLLPYLSISLLAALHLWFASSCKIVCVVQQALFHPVN